jgi:pimeloyl-ACP methyl ester carboxylesterase
MERYDKPGDKRRPELERIHAPQDWSLVSKTNSRLYQDYGREPPLSDADLQAIDAPVLLVSSNRDQIVPWDETLALAKLIPHTEVVMFYGPAHPIAVVPLDPVGRAIAAWMEKARHA